MKILLVILVAIICPVLASAKKKVDPRLEQVTAIFVKGNSQAADKAREKLSEGKTCFSLATKADDADAVLDISDSATADSGTLGSFGRRHNVVSGTLTVKAGDLIWSHTARFSDAPFMSGAKTAADILVSNLARDAACKERTRKKGAEK